MVQNRECENQYGPVVVVSCNSCKKLIKAASLKHHYSCFPSGCDKGCPHCEIENPRYSVESSLKYPWIFQDLKEEVGELYDVIDNIEAFEEAYDIYKNEMIKEKTNI